jgi:hypothetical protein
MRKGLFAFALVCVSLVGCNGCGGGGGTVNPGGDYDGVGTSLPAADPGTAIIIDHEEAYATAALIPDTWLTQGVQQQVIFGHQSVGYNIISGLESLEGYNSRYNVNVVEFPTSDINGCVSQFGVGDNSDPQSKIDDFVAKVNGGTMVGATVATFKFCYVDFGSDTDANAVFTAYKNAMAQLETDHPTIKFVYWTAPITTDYLESRQQFNTLVRNYCSANNKVLFDIASIEAYTPADAAVGGAQPTLYSGYTSDGGHLNEAGSLRVARAWWWLMARISGWDGS